MNFIIDGIPPPDFTDGTMAISPMAIKALEVRGNAINWNVYLQSQIITQDHYDCIVILETYGKQKRDHLLAHHGAQCARLLLEMAKSIANPLPVQYILTLIDDVLQVENVAKKSIRSLRKYDHGFNYGTKNAIFSGVKRLVFFGVFFQEDRNRANAFHQYAAAGSGSKAWTLFFPFLNRDDQFIRNQASRIIAKLACWSSDIMPEADLKVYMLFLKEQIRLPVSTVSFCYIEHTRIHVVIDRFRRVHSLECCPLGQRLPPSDGALSTVAAAN